MLRKRNRSTTCVTHRHAGASVEVELAGQQSDTVRRGDDDDSDG